MLYYIFTKVKDLKAHFDTLLSLWADSAVVRGTLSEFRETPAAEVSALFVTVPCVVCGQREGLGQLEHHLSLAHMCLYDTAVVTPNSSIYTLRRVNKITKPPSQYNSQFREPHLISSKILKATAQVSRI